MRPDPEAWLRLHVGRAWRNAGTLEMEGAIGRINTHRLRAVAERLCEERDGMWRLRGAEPVFDPAARGPAPVIEWLHWRLRDGAWHPSWSIYESAAQAGITYTRLIKVLSAHCDKKNRGLAGCDWRLRRAEQEA